VYPSNEGLSPLLLGRAERDGQVSEVSFGFLTSGKVWGAAVGVYVVFWAGGNWSFGYTHRCVRSHVEQAYDPAVDDLRDRRVCDWYTANDKRWTLLDPLRAVIGWDF